MAYPERVGPSVVVQERDPEHVGPRRESPSEVDEKVVAEPAEVVGALVGEEDHPLVPLGHRCVGGT